MPSACTQRSPSRPPSSSPMSISSDKSSWKRPAHGFSITAIATARRAGGSTALPISTRTSSTCTTSFLIFAFIFSHLLRQPDNAYDRTLILIAISAQAIVPLDLSSAQTSDTLVHARAAGHHQHVDELVGQRRARHIYLDRIEVAAHVTGVDVCHGDIELGPGRTDLLGRWHERFRAAEHFAHRIAAGYMPQCAMLDFAVAADDCALAVAFELLGARAQSRQQAPRHFDADRIERLHHR